MAKNFANTVNVTSPTQKAKSTQVENNAGGYVFELDPMARVRRFLILGSTANTYYATGNAVLSESLDAINNALAVDGKAVVDEIISVSDGGRAARNDPAIFALACAASYKVSSDDENAAQIRSYALSNLGKVCRIGTHLFTFLTYVKNMRGFGRSLRRAIANWYENMPVEKLAMQVCKYQSRRVEGGTPWTHLDALRLGHPVARDNFHNDIYRYVVGKETVNFPEDRGTPIDYIYWHEYAKNATTVKEILKAIEKGISRESIPTEYLNKPEVWEAMLEKGMPLTAMIRNLGKMSAINVLNPLSNASKIIINALDDENTLRKARVHPLNVLAAYLTYNSGHGFRGDLVWDPVQSVLDALDGAFYKCFKFIEPTGKNFLLGIDVSGSMRSYNVAGLDCMTCAQAAAAQAMVIARTEKNYQMMGFATEFRDLGITSKDSLQIVCNKTDIYNFGGTDCSLPMQYALDNQLDVDAFMVLTDSETWFDNHIGHPFQVLTRYRKEMNKPNAKLIVVGMVGNTFSIADPSDPFSLDCEGFDTNTPRIISDFVMGKI